MNNFFKKVYIAILIIPFVLNGCISGPPIIQKYSSNEMKNDFNLDKSVLIYKIIIEGDNYDKMVQKIVLDKVSIYFSNIGVNIFIDDNVFADTADLLKYNFEDLNDEYDCDYIFLLIIRTKNLGYSIKTLSEETNIYLNSTLLDDKGNVISSSLFSKTALYTISKIKRFHYDLIKVLNPIKSSIQSLNSDQK